MRNLKSLSILALATLSLGATSCKESVATKGEKSYKTLTIANSSTSVSRDFSASIRGEQYVDIRPQISGAITQIAIDEGATIKRGQTLFIIDQVPYKAALEVAIANVKSAEANVATAKLNAESDQALYDEDVISKNELQVTLNALASAEANLVLAKAQETIARNDLSYTVVKSPVDGVAGMINYRIGALVSSSISDPLVSVSNNNKMYAYFSLSESSLLTMLDESGSTEQLLEDMDSIALKLSNGSRYSHLGFVDAISGVVDQSTGTVSIRAIFDNPDQILRDGGNGALSLTTNYEDVIVIPKVATYEIQNKILVFKVVDGKAVSAQIAVLPSDNGKDYIVTSGVSIGDVIIAEGAGLLREGTIVTNQK